MIPNENRTAILWMSFGSNLPAAPSFDPSIVSGPIVSLCNCLCCFYSFDFIIIFIASDFFVCPTDWIRGFEPKQKAHFNFIISVWFRFELVPTPPPKNLWHLHKKGYLSQGIHWLWVFFLWLVIRFFLFSAFLAHFQGSHGHTPHLPHFLYNFCFYFHLFLCPLCVLCLLIKN